MSVGWYLVICTAALAACVGECRLLYVSPTSSSAADPCPKSGEPCLTLDEYITSSSTYIASNTVFRFLPGQHAITRPFVARNVGNITLEGSAEGDANPLVQLLVRSTGRNKDAAFIFVGAGGVSVTGIDTVGFGVYFERTVRLSLTRVTVWNVTYGDGVVLDGVRRGLLQNVSVHNSTGSGLRLIRTRRITALRTNANHTASN